MTRAWWDWSDYEPGEIDYEQGLIFGEDIIAFRRCPTCGRYLRVADDATVRVNGLEDVVGFEGFSCTQCGDVQPAWTRTA